MIAVGVARPRLTNVVVIARCVEKELEAVKTWWASFFDEEFSPEFPGALAVAMVNANFDRAWAVIGLHDLGYVVNDDILAVMSRINSHRVSTTTEMVHEWVMKNAFRLDSDIKEGAKIKFRIGDTEMEAEVAAAVNREYRVLVDFGNGNHVSVNGEEIINVTKKAGKKKVASNDGPDGGDYPTGGTPVAARMAVA